MRQSRAGSQRISDAGASAAPYATKVVPGIDGFHVVRAFPLPMKALLGGDMSLELEACTPPAACGDAGQDPPESGDFLMLLGRHRAGDPSAQVELVRLIYADLRRIAHRHVAGNPWMGTLDTTSIVHESWLRLAAPAAAGYVTTRAHFLNLASRVMRQILIDYARRRLREAERFDRDTPLEDVDEYVDAELAQARQIVAVEEALRDLARLNARLAHIVECRFYGGLSEDETAAALDLSLRTVQRGWNEARAWLLAHLRET